MLNKQRVREMIQAQRWDEAKVLCTQICQSDGNDAEAWFLMGAIHGHFEDFAGAEECGRRVIASRPDIPTAHFNLGIALQKQGKYQEAIDCLRQAILLSPNYAEAHNELGVALQLVGEGDLDSAVECYRKALALKPAYPEAHYNLATALRDLSNKDDAEAHFEETLRLNPMMLEAYIAYGIMLKEYGQYAKAAATFQMATQHFPNDLGLAVELGMALLDLGQQQKAEQNFERVLKLQPDNVEVCARLAQLSDRKGEFEAGYAWLRPLLEKGTDSVSVALAFAALAKHLGQQEQAIALLERLLQDRKTATERKIMHFALGKIYDEQKSYDQAFKHYQSANELDNKKLDMEWMGGKFDELITVFSEEDIARRPRASNKSRLPIFIVGMPRSGTSLIEQILATHGDVYGAGELEAMPNLVSSLPRLLDSKLHYPYCVDLLKRKGIDEIAQRHLARLAAYSSQAKKVTDKLPHNFLHLGMIDMLFPGARIIHCMRDPIDTCLSIYSLPFNATHRYASDLVNLGAYHRRYQGLMAHWKKVLRVPILEVQYEELVANQEEETRKMLDFCGLGWDERCLRFYESERATLTFSYDQVRRPLYKKSVARWKNYEQHLNPLITALQDDCENK
jgi:tetratricopeptide (TPR) repeat protein